MSNNVESAMLEILKRIQADVSTVKTDVTDLKGRVERLETFARRQRRDSAAMLVMMRGVVGVFEERMRNLEDDVADLKRRD